MGKGTRDKKDCGDNDDHRDKRYRGDKNEGDGKKDDCHGKEISKRRRSGPVRDVQQYNIKNASQAVNSEPARLPAPPPFYTDQGPDTTSTPLHRATPSNARARASSSISGRAAVRRARNLSTTQQLDFLRNNPAFQILRRVVQRNPLLLYRLLRQLEVGNPMLSYVIRTHFSEFRQMLRGDQTPGQDLKAKVMDWLEKL